MDVSCLAFDIWPRDGQRRQTDDSNIQPLHIWPWWWASNQQQSQQ